MENNVDYASDLAELVQMKPVAVDRVSALPNEVIELILSKLVLRDAIRTGALSFRWKHLWEYTTGTLDFDFEYEKKWSFQVYDYDDPRHSEHKRVDKARYINSVNKILNAHKGSTIEAFNAIYDLDGKYQLDIDNWIDFALQKKVRRLELNFTQPHAETGCAELTFPYKFPLLGKSRLSCLTSLSLHYVDTSDEMLYTILSNCPFLESLSIGFSSVNEFVHLDPCPKLKHLEISWCFQPLEISSAPNLTSFVFVGYDTSLLSIKNVPNLTHVSLGGRCARNVVQKLCELPSFLFQLKKLSLELCALMIFPQFPKFPELINVTELKLTCTYDDYGDEKKSDIFSCNSLLEACPNLYRFSMQFQWLFFEKKVDDRPKWSVNKCLKVVELDDFKGEQVQFEFYKCLLSSAPSLEKITVDVPVYSHKKRLKIDKTLRRFTYKFSPSAELVTIIDHSE